MNVSKNLQIELYDEVIINNYIKFINKYNDSLTSDEMLLYIYLYECAKYNIVNIELSKITRNSILNLQMLELIEIEYENNELLIRIHVKNPMYNVASNNIREVIDFDYDNEFYKMFVRLNIQNDEKELIDLACYCDECKLQNAEFEKRLFNSLDHNSNIINIEQFKQIKNKEEVVNSLSDIINQFEKYDSNTFLQKISNGRTLNSSETKIITVLREKYKMTDSVINVLLDYVIRINEGNISKSLVESIASAWSRNNLSNASDAINFVKKYNSKKNTSKKANIAPDWLNEDKNEESNKEIDFDLYEKFKEL